MSRTYSFCAVFGIMAAVMAPQVMAAPATPAILSGWWSAMNVSSIQCTAQYAMFSQDGLTVRSIPICGTTPSGQPEPSLYEVDMLYSRFVQLADGSYEANATELFTLSAGPSRTPAPSFMVNMRVSPDVNTLTVTGSFAQNGEEIVFKRMPRSASPLRNGAYTGSDMTFGHPDQNGTVFANVDGPLGTFAVFPPASHTPAIYVTVQAWDPPRQGMMQRFISGDLPTGTTQYCSYISLANGGVHMACCEPNQCSTYPNMTTGTSVYLNPLFA